MHLTGKQSLISCLIVSAALLTLGGVLGIIANNHSRHGVALLPKHPSGLVVIETERAKLLHEENVLFIDARTPDTYSQAHISGAYGLDYYDLDAKFDAFASQHDQSTPMVVYCEGVSGDHNEDTCSTSRMLVEALLQRGYSKAMLYEQGFAFWEKAGLPIESGASAGHGDVTKIPAINHARDLVMLVIGLVALFLVRNRPAMTIVKLLLGVIFVISASSKMFHADKLEVILDAYRILPPAVLPFAAACVPWIELVAGIALLSMVFSGPGAVLVAGMNLFFIPALSYRAWLLSKQLGISIFGVNFDCGCGLGENFAWVLILRDVGFLLMAAAVLLASVTIAGRTGRKT